MTKKQFTEAVQAKKGNTHYSGKTKTMFVTGMTAANFNKNFGRHFGLNTKFKISV